MSSFNCSIFKQKFIKSRNVIFLLILLVLKSTTAVRSQTIQSDIAYPADVQKWIGQNFAKGKIPPFSFVYGGKKSDSFIKSWQFKAEKLKPEDPSILEYIYTYSDKNSGLTVKCFVTSFSDFPAVEWVLKFSNSSAKNSLLIEKAAVADHSFLFEGKNTFILHYARGSNATRSDFQPVDKTMNIDEHIYMTPAGGRSSDNTAFPFFNIESSSKAGIMVSIGWSGKWFADVSQADEKTVSLRSGMEKMHLVLYPGEEIRTPKICMLFWKSEERMTGHNQFRQFILKHHSRQINGTFAEYPLSGSFDYGDPQPCNEYTCLTEEFAVALVKRYQYFKILPELFWLDAGWYAGCGWNKEKGGWWQNVGNWSVDRERFPNGLKPVSDAVHNAGSKFMVWFEPERVSPGTMIDREHSGWLIKLPGNDNYLFDLGNKDARIWLTDYISDFLKNEGIDYYRQDFNFDPLPYWEANDKPDRKGISEIKHIEGLYAFWDSLLVRFPNMLIDNCASGGRRIDLETTSRSSPLWRTDYQYGEPNGYQCHTYGLSFYLPIHGTAVYKTDNYTFRSGLGGTAVMNWEVTGRDSESLPAIQKRIEDFKSLRPYYYGDFYPLTEGRDNTGDNRWLAYQLNRPEQKDGIIVVFRRGGCQDESITVKLHGLKENADYELFYEDYGLRTTIRGRELMDILLLTIPQRPASLLIRYRMIE
jgi:alpha-galactosidase